MSADLPIQIQSGSEALALATPQRLGHLVHLVGITLHSPAIAGVLRSEQQRDIKHLVGTLSYEFALRRGRFLLQQGCLADVAAAVVLTEVGTLKADCQSLGLRALATALSESPMAIVRRVQLKFCKRLVERHWRPLASVPADFLRLFFLIDRQADFQ